LVPGTLLEDKTREAIDQKLEAAGWVIQDKKRLNLYESLGVAVREVFDEGCAFCCKVGKESAEESITSLLGMNVVALQCAVRVRALGMMRAKVTTDAPRAKAAL